MKMIKEIFRKINNWLHPKFVIISSIWALISITIVMATFTFLAWVVYITDYPVMLVNIRTLPPPGDNFFEVFWFIFPVIKLVTTIAGMVGFSAGILIILRDQAQSEILHIDREYIEDIILEMGNEAKNARE